MTSGVYAIVHKVSGMAYVGSSVDIELRWSKHRSDLRRGYGPARLMVEAWQDGGDQVFDFLILEEALADDDALEEAESRWFKHYEGRLCNRHKVARRRVAGMATMAWKMKWSGGKLTDYQQRQLARLERRRPSTAAPGGTRGEE